MPLDFETDSFSTAWQRAQDELADAHQQLAVALPGIACQAAYTRLVAAQRGCTSLIHAWLGQALQLKRVIDPRLVLSLDVDGILEEEIDGFSAAGVTGAAALKLLQLGRVAVLLNTGRSLTAVQERVEQFALMGGVASFGSAAWDVVFTRIFSLLSVRGQEQLGELRQVLSMEPGFVMDPSYAESVRVSRVRDGMIAPIGGPEARALLDHHGLTDLNFWVAPSHTDFADRGADKATGLWRLREELGLNRLPLAATGDGTCDIPTLRQASRAFVPAATLPSYVPASGQRLVRSRHLGERSLWDAAQRLVQDPSLHRRVRAMVEGIKFPEWFPTRLQRPPPSPARFHLSAWRLARLH
jgi:hypothetical protein